MEHQLKKVCSCCIRDEYLKKLIKLNGKVGECDYCKGQNGKKLKPERSSQLKN
nr:MAG TPA: HEPN/RES N-terminal domain 1 [Caudoviricetes sp.]